jgi:hypothetical protein
MLNGNGDTNFNMRSKYRGSRKLKIILKPADYYNYPNENCAKIVVNSYFIISSDTKFAGVLILVIVQCHYYLLFAGQVPAQTSVIYLSFKYYEIQILGAAFEKAK